VEGHRTALSLRRKEAKSGINTAIRLSNLSGYSKPSESSPIRGFFSPGEGSEGMLGCVRRGVVL